MKTNKKVTKEDAAKREMTKSAGKDDVHEQREPDQQVEGVVRQAPEAQPKPAPATKR